MRKRARLWMRWIAGATRHAKPERPIVAALAEQFNVHTALRALPWQLESSSLPNGVVELLIEDFEAPTRQLFDIHDGHITLVEPGKAVPWASIAGSATAWAMALGPDRNPTALQITGDEQLAQRVLAALPPPA
jgi:hypothetical protein